MGISYRQDVGDTRYSPAEVFVREAQRKGAHVYCQDPLVGYWDELNMDVMKEIFSFAGYDAVVFAVQYDEYSKIDFALIDIDDNTLIFDANDVLQENQRQTIQGRTEIRFASIGR